jgi:hypothetical protein
VTERLDAKRYVLVILRPLLRRHGELDHGELVDLDGSVQGRFRRWSGVSVAVSNWATRRDAEPSSDSSAEFGNAKWQRTEQSDPRAMP